VSFLSFFVVCAGVGGGGGVRLVTLGGAGGGAIYILQFPRPKREKSTFFCEIVKLCGDGGDSVHSLFGRDEACQVGDRGRARQALPRCLQADPACLG
jgi:hypothetical protein